MSEARHVKEDLRYVIHKNVSWLEYLAATHAHPVELRDRTEVFSGKQTLTTEIKVADKWFPNLRTHSIEKKTNFIGVFDLTALFNCIIADRTFYSDTNGAGTFTGVNDIGGGVRLQTGATSGNDNLLTDGDNNGPIYAWEPRLQLFMHTDFRFPMIGDIEDTYSLVCLYADDDNYAGIRYDPNGVYFPAHSNMFFVTRSEGVEQVTGLGVPEVGTWYSTYLKIVPGETWLVMNDRVVAEHLSYIPVGPLCFYAFLETQANSAKRQDIKHVSMTQYEL